MSSKKFRPFMVAITSTVLMLGASACGLTEEVETSNEVEKDDQRVVELNDRVTNYWRTLAEGDSTGAFDFLSSRCKTERTESSVEMVASYEQRHINKMAYLRKSTDELVNSMSYTIKNINSGNKVSLVSIESSLEGINMPSLRWVRSDVDNKWYLDSCRPPFNNKREDQSSYRLERERDSRAYEEGMIEDDGNYNDGIDPGAETGETNDSQGY